MKTVLSSRIGHYFERLGILLLVVVLTIGTTGCTDPVVHPVTKIESWEDLHNIRYTLEGSYVLMSNLDEDTEGYDKYVGNTTDGKGWQPIGIKGNAFKGVFDGNGGTISDLFIYRPDQDEVGLFGRVQTALIKNVGLVSVNVTGSQSVGALVGYSMQGTLYSETVAAYSQTYSRGSVTGEEDVGGLVGCNYEGSVRQCQSSAEIFPLSSAPEEIDWHFGGLVGLNAGTVENCDYNGVVNGDYEVGGLVGHNALAPAGLVQDCGGNYSVDGNLRVGGVVGKNRGTIRRASYEGTVKGIQTTEVHGLIALSEGATANAYSLDGAPPGSYVGGVVGDNEGDVEDCSADATVEGCLYVGGVAGGNNGTVEDSSSHGSVTGEDFVGGLVGYNAKGGTVSDDCHSNAHVEGTGDHVKDRVGCDEAADSGVAYNLHMAVAPAGAGTATDLTGAPPYSEGQVVSIKAVPAAGYHFVSWIAPAGTFANANAADTTFTMPAQDVTVTANFEVGAPHGVAVRDWYDLDALRDDLQDSYVLMNDLDSTTAGYMELATETANEGRGWEPIGSEEFPFVGSFDGQGYEISDLFINRPEESNVGLFSVVDEAGVIKDIGVVNADVTGGEAVGILVGRNCADVSNSYSTGSVAGDWHFGGLVGRNWLGTVSNSHSICNVTGDYGAGGLVGGNFGTVDRSYSTGSVNGNSSVGGLVGSSTTGTVSNSYSAGSVAGGEYIGGLVGYSTGAVSDSYSVASVTGGGSVGGLVGFDYGTVSNSYSTGNVTGDYEVGGLVGQNAGSVSSSYSSSSVSGNWTVGGLVGGNPGTVTDCYYAGSVTGNLDVGGLVGYSEGEDNVSNSFWDIQTSGQSTSDGGTGKTTAQMEDIATFSSAGWDITAVANPGEPNPSYIWNIVNGVTYPFLSWQP